MNNKQKEILKKHFDMEDITYSNGVYTSLEQWTNGGVDMIIEFEKNRNVIDALQEYIDNFDIDEEIEIYRQDKRYRENFTIRESLADFENWIDFIRNIIKQLKESE